MAGVCHQEGLAAALGGDSGSDSGSAAAGICPSCGLAGTGARVSILNQLGWLLHLLHHTSLGLGKAGSPQLG